jgi:hypothetical protein
MNSAQKECGLSFTFRVMLFTRASRPGLRHINSIRYDTNWNTEAEPPNMLGFRLGSRVMAICPSQIPSLIELPRNVFFPAPVVHRPGLKHASRAYDPWDTTPCREFGKFVIVRQPYSIVVQDIHATKTVQGLSLASDQ